MKKVLILNTDLTIYSVKQKNIAISKLQTSGFSPQELPLPEESMFHKSAPHNLISAAQPVPLQVRGRDAQKPKARV